jgi:AraC-like DNA-binding protein
MKMNPAFLRYNAICLLSVCCVLLPPVLEFVQTGGPPGSAGLSAALLTGCILLLLLPLSEESPDGSFRFALLAGIASLAAALAGLPGRMRVLALLLVQTGYLWFRNQERYEDLWPLFRPARVWNNVECHARDTYVMALFVLAAFFPWPGAPAALRWAYLALCGLMYLLLSLRVILGRTLLLSRRKELELKELVRGSLRNAPTLVENRSEEMGRMQQLYDRVSALMEEKKPFLDYEFTIADLAGAVFSNRAYLSKTINVISGRNFNQFVNGYRVRYSVDLLRRDPFLRVIDVALMSGFHTVVTFNMAFKLNMGETPSRFQERLRLEWRTAQQSRAKAMSADAEKPDGHP